MRAQAEGNQGQQGPRRVGRTSWRGQLSSSEHHKQDSCPTAPLLATVFSLRVTLKPDAF